jgi:uncharacterized surface protein with fasciclin (FAS1) repeats
MLLSSFLVRVRAADLVETLSGEGPFTVFAPTEEAFGKLTEGTQASECREDEHRVQKWRHPCH